MAGNALTVFELEADGYTHVSCFCEGCRHTVLMPFRMIRRRAPFIITNMTLDQLQAKFTCKRCPDNPRPKSVQPWRQSDSPGYVLDRAHRGNYLAAG